VTDIPIIPGLELPLPGRGLDQDALWLTVGFKSGPARDCQLVKGYCWEHTKVPARVDHSMYLLSQLFKHVDILNYL
jgi:hypothetical protein